MKFGNSERETAPERGFREAGVLGSNQFSQLVEAAARARLG